MNEHERWWLRYGQSAFALAYLRQIGAELPGVTPVPKKPFPRAEPMRPEVKHDDDGRSTDNSAWTNDGELEFNFDQRGPHED